MLIVLFLNAIRLKKNKEKGENMETTKNNGIISFKISGMRCNHCKNTVTNAISKLPSVQEVTVNLSDGVAHVKGTPSNEEIKKAVEALGFEFKGQI